MKNKNNVKMIVAIIVMLSFILPGMAKADSGALNVYLFWGQGCPHCVKEKEFLKFLEIKYKDKISIIDYEVYYNSENAELYQKYALNSGLNGVPATYIGNQAISGYLSDSTTGAQLDKAIEQCLTNGCPDAQEYFVTNKNNVINIINENNDKTFNVNIPFIGERNMAKYSLFGLTAAIGFIDGFNPCAMWVLLFLITMLLGFKDRKRAWFLGIAFITVSAVTYFIFLAAWLSFFKFIGAIRIVQVLIGAFALIAGSYYFKKFIKMKPGECEVTSPEQKIKIIDKLKKVAAEKTIWLALTGIIALAFAVNLIELACSAGLPAIYTQVLTLHNLNIWHYYAYLMLYILFFMLDDMLVFAIAMITLKSVSSTGKYGRYGTLIGGLVILLIGLLLLIKPSWLALN